MNYFLWKKKIKWFFFGNLSNFFFMMHLIYAIQQLWNCIFCFFFFSGKFAIGTLGVGKSYFFSLESLFVSSLWWIMRWKCFGVKSTSIKSFKCFYFVQKSPKRNWKKVIPEQFCNNKERKTWMTSLHILNIIIDYIKGLKWINVGIYSKQPQLFVQCLNFRAKNQYQTCKYPWHSVQNIEPNV